MNKKWLVLGTAVALAAVGSVASAQNRANGEQKGSLLIWPYVNAVDDGTTKTFVSITNDGADARDILCYFMDRNKNKVDREFRLTKNQTLTLDIGEEWTLSEPRGMIACWVIKESTIANAEDQQIVWNHLFGKANVIDYNNGTAFEYRAWAFRALGTQDAAVGAPGEINLDGVQYDKCPKTLLGEFTPPEICDPGDPDPSSCNGAIKHLLVTTACDLDFRQDANFLATKLLFTIYDNKEHKRSGTWKCADSWHENYLGYENSPEVSPDFPAVWPNGRLWREAALGNWDIDTDYGYFQVVTSASNQCNARLRMDGTLVKATAPGLIGVLVNEFTFGKLMATSASDLSFSGEKTGTILYDPNATSDSKK